MTTPSPIALGAVLAGKYRVERVLGQGGMGVVVAATNIPLNQLVALKFLLPAAIGQREIYDRFAREAQACAKLRTQHVAKVLDVGALPGPGHEPYMVMEYLDGRDLSALLRAEGPMPVEDAVEYILQACEAVAEAHAAGIVHRDIKPANLFRTRNPDGSPCVKLLDFGISKAVDAEVALTSAAHTLGSPQYMSPEQMKSSAKVDEQTDIWALGVTLYEILAGTPPFGGTSVPEVCASVLSAEVPRIISFRAGVPPGLEAAITKCLTRDPARRFRTVTELAAALGPFAPARAAAYVARVAATRGVGKPAAAPVIGGAAPVAPAASGEARSGESSQARSTAMSSARDTTGPTKRKLPIALLVGGVIGAMGIGGFGIVALLRSQAPAAATTAATGQPDRAAAATPAVTAKPEPSLSASSPVVPASSAVAAAATPTATSAPMASASGAASARPPAAGPGPVSKPGAAGGAD